MGVLSKLAGGSRPDIPKKPVLIAPEPAPAKVVKRDARGRLLPGQANLNPGGRPKGIEQNMRELYARAGGDALIEGVIAGAVIMPDGQPMEVRDVRLRVETARWVFERANGKALERSASVNVDLAGGEAPIALDRLPEGVLRGLLDHSEIALAHNTPQLPQGEIVDADFQLEDLPGTDAVSDQSNKA